MNIILDTETITIHQDEWSLTRPKFGNKAQLEVLGWIEKHLTTKYYLVKCSICSKDEELFGKGLFKILKTNIIKNRMPCGCAFNPKWNKDQIIVLCTREAHQRGIEFLGFNGEYKGINTKLKLMCNQPGHGEWDTTTVSNFHRSKGGCPACKALVTSQTNRKPDEEMIASFFASGAFHPDTKFWRSDRVSSKGWKCFWYVECQECG